MSLKLSSIEIRHFILRLSKDRQKIEFRPEDTLCRQTYDGVSYSRITGIQLK